MNTELMRDVCLLPDYGQIAFYFRLSMADGDFGRGEKDESNSIENQRLLLREYVGRIIMNSMDEEYDEAYMENIINTYLEAIPEYIDDGYSGTNFDRPAFKRMIEDAKKKQIHTIIVKDTSRLGRDYIEVGDYMEQIFPLLGIRFIAVNSNYDGNNYRNTTQGFETSIMNLVNAEYSKDLSRKVKSAHSTLWRQGVSTSSKAPFGYVVENHKYVIDPEAASYVRLIFDKAIEGWNTSMIVNLLNEHGVPAPGLYIKQKTGRDCVNRIVSDDEWLWDREKVTSVLKNYSYTEAMVHGKTKGISVGSKSRRQSPRKDWYVVDGMHEAIVSTTEWQDAQAIFRVVKRSGIRMENDFSLKGKIRCGNCGLAMEYSEVATPVVYCSHAQSAGKASKCNSTRYDAKGIESIVAYELKRQIQLLEYLELKVQEQRSERRKAIDITILRRQTETNIEILKAEKVRQYEAYAEGVVKREEYMRKKNEIADKLARLEEALKRVEDIEKEETGLLGEIRKVTDKAEKLNERKTNNKPLTREIVLAMIDTVTIHNEQTIEVKFTFDDLGQRAMAYAESHAIEPKEQAV